MSNCVSLLISGFTSIFTLLGVLWAVYQYSKESIRKKRSETLTVYNALFNEIYSFRESYYNATNELLFSADKIYAKPEWYKKIMILLTQFESFSKGLEYGIYDFEIFIHLTPKEMFEMLNSLKQFVYEERTKKAYSFLFNDFIHLVDVMSISIQKKMNHEEFEKNYKKIKV